MTSEQKLYTRKIVEDIIGNRLGDRELKTFEEVMGFINDLSVESDELNEYILYYLLEKFELGTV